MEPCERGFVRLQLLSKPEEELTRLPLDVKSGFAFAVDRVHDNLGTFANLRSGRMSAPDPDGLHLV